MIGGKMKTSKAPWSVSQHGSQILNAEGRVILEASQFVHHLDLENINDDVKIASLAPDMYSIITTILFEDELTDRTKHWIKEFIKMVDPELIEKAEANINPRKG